MPKDVLYVFVHITKTGGMTFKNLLEKNFTKEQIYRVFEFVKPFDSFHKNVNKDELLCINGHFNLNFAESCGLFPGKTFHYFTLLREPVDRGLSFYYHQKRKRPELPPIPIWLENKNGVSYIERNNIMTKRLSSTVNPTRDDLELAKNNLLGMNFGFTEQFDEAVDGFQKTFPDVFKRMDYHKRNVNSDRVKKVDEPQEIIDLVRKKNDLDVELYAFAKKLWKKKLKQ